MPTPPAHPNVIRFRLWFDLDHGYQGGVGHYFTYTGNLPGAGDLNVFCTKIKTEFSTHLASFMKDNYSLTQVTCRDLTSGGAEGIDTTAVPGTDSNPEIGVDTAALVNLKIGRNYRGGRPRIYWPFGTTTSLEDEHEWTDGFVTALDAAMTAYFGAIQGTNSNLTTIGVLCSLSQFAGFDVVINPRTGRAANVPKYRGLPGDAALLPPDAVTSWHTSKLIGTQRRRVRSTGR